MYFQDIVPPELLLKYVCMVEPVLSHVVDSEITRYCAHSLPAVAYTLGKKNWVCLSKLCELLASDMQVLFIVFYFSFTCSFVFGLSFLIYSVETFYSPTFCYLFLVESEEDDSSIITCFGSNIGLRNCRK